MTELDSLIEQLRTRSGLPNEETTKFATLQPILQAVGWKTYDTTEVLYEHSVGGRKAGGRVDIALRSGSSNRVLALIEAKAPREDLRNHIDQVLNYAYHEGCDICVLTNGIEWWLFLPREAGRPLDRRFTTLNLNTTPAEQLAEDFKTFLGKENLISGKTAQQAKRVLEANQIKARLERKIPEIWKNMLSQADDELVELIVKRVYERIDLRPEQDQVKAILHGTPMPLSMPKPPAQPEVIAHPTASTQPSKPTPQPNNRRTTTSSGKRLKPTMIRIFGETHPVKTWKDVLIEVASVLYKLHPHKYDQMLQNLWGNHKSAISTDPESIRSSFRPPGAQFYVNLGYSAQNLCERTNHLLQALDHSENELQYQVRLVENRATDENDAQDQDDLQIRIKDRWISSLELTEIFTSLYKQHTKTNSAT